MFFTDWSRTMGWGTNTFMFDAFHPFYQTVLQVEPTEQTVRVAPVEDHGAAILGGHMDLEVYVESVIKTCGTDRLVSDKWPRQSNDLRMLSTFTGT